MIVDAFANRTVTSLFPFVLSRFKNDQPVNASTGKRPHTVIKENTLTINNAMQDDVANYSCHLVDSKNNNSLIAKNKFVVVGKYFFFNLNLLSVPVAFLHK